MLKTSVEKSVEQQLCDLYPQLTGEQRNTARETLDRYLELAWEVYEEKMPPAAPPVMGPPVLQEAKSELRSMESAISQNSANPTTYLFDVSKRPG